MFKLPFQVWLLVVALSFVSAAGPLIVFVGGVVGMQLSPDPKWATLPIACMILGNACSTIPIAKLSAVIGRKKAFIIAMLVGIATALLASFAIVEQHFWLFCLAISLFGIAIAAAQQFRFAAIELVGVEQAPNAASAMLLAGLVAAFIGPELAFQGRYLVAEQFAGSFVLLALSLLITIILLLFFKAGNNQATEQSEQLVRPLNVLIRQPSFIIAVTSGAVAFAVMSFVMTATPIGMTHFQNFDLQDTKWVIQSHVIAMYLPSFFTGALITRFGHFRIMTVGLSCFCIALSIGMAGHHYLHYWHALVFLGLAWNFMFVAATSLLPHSYRANERFRAQGLNDFILIGCQAVASLLAGWVLYTFGWTYMLLGCFPVLLIALVVFILHRGKLNCHAS